MSSKSSRRSMLKKAAATVGGGAAATFLVSGADAPLDRAKEALQVVADRTTIGDVIVFS